MSIHQLSWNHPLDELLGGYHWSIQLCHRNPIHILGESVEVITAVPDPGYDDILPLTTILVLGWIVNITSHTPASLLNQDNMDNLGGIYTHSNIYLKFNIIASRCLIPDGDDYRSYKEVMPPIYMAPTGVSWLRGVPLTLFNTL